MGNPLLAAGKLDRRVTIVRDGAEVSNNSWSGAETQAGTDSWGEEEAQPAGEITRWASQKPAPGTERFESAQNAATALWRFVFRWEHDLVRETDRLRSDDGQEWDVKSVSPIGRREGWEVLAAMKMELP